MSDILAFFREEPNPSGYNIFDITHNWTDDDWEMIHDFIQWIFPLQEPSNFNPDAPILTAEDIEAFKLDKELQNQMFRAFHRFMAFLGLKCEWVRTEEGKTEYSDNFLGEKVVAKGEWVTRELQLNEQHPLTGVIGVVTEKMLKEKGRLWEHPNHNWLRITRCLRSLRLVGLGFAAESFYKCLCKLWEKHKAISVETFKYWQDAVEGEL